MTDILLILAAFATATLTAVTGVGGGMMLIAFMPGLLPAQAVVPVHAVVQLFSNLGRASFGWRSVKLGYLPAFAAGSLVGGSIAAGVTRQINLDYTPLIIAIYILYSVWGPKFPFRAPPKGEFAVIGMIQTGLSMIVGATGPLGQASLLRRGLRRDALVVTAALMMSFTHLIKIILFAALGFSFVAYWQIIIGMSAGVVGGALLGTHIRYRVPETFFAGLLRWILTLLALRMVYITHFA